MSLSLSFPTWVDAPGTPSTPGASDLNRLQGNDTFFARRPIVSLARSVDQTIANQTPTVLGWNSDTADPDGMHAAGSSEIICTVPGWYWITATVAWDVPASPTGYRSLRIRRDDIPITRDDRLAVPLISTVQSAGRMMTLVVGSKITVEVVHSQGGLLNISGGTIAYPSFEMIWIRQL